MSLTMINLRRIEEPTMEKRVAGARPQHQLPQLERMVGSKVIDETGEDMGRVECFWEDDTHQAQYIGVRTGWLGLGAIHVIPVDAVQYNPASDIIRVPFSKAVVKDAPAYDAEDELDSVRRREIFDYYNSKGGKYSQPAGQPVADQSYRQGVGAPPRVQSQQTNAQPTTSMRQGEEVRVPLHEEKLSVGKREVEAGGVRLRKVIRTEVVQQPVELRHEELVVERGPASGTTSSESKFEGEEIYIPLRAEKPVIQKEVVTTGEVRARKQPTVERTTVSEKLRKEDVETQRTEEVREKK